MVCELYNKWIYSGVIMGFDWSGDTSDGNCYCNTGIGNGSDFGATVKKYTVRTGDNTTTLTPPIGAHITILIAGGGGGGGARKIGVEGGGGGAGGYLAGNIDGLIGAQTIIVGSGGAKGVSFGDAGTNGANSSFGSFVAYGGGGGGGADNPSGGTDGGSGGGAGGNEQNIGNATQTSQTPLIGHGNNGGLSWSTQGSGGGGASGSGGSDRVAGIGISSSITGSNVTYCTGGTVSNTTVTPNLGNGGDGALSGDANDGGSGVVIIRYTFDSGSGIGICTNMFFIGS